MKAVIDFFEMKINLYLFSSVESFFAVNQKNSFFKLKINEPKIFLNTHTIHSIYLFFLKEEKSLVYNESPIKSENLLKCLLKPENYEELVLGKLKKKMYLYIYY